MPAPPSASRATTVARRAQIIAATIETIADLGYARTTFARIAERGGLSSTRLISYHFASKDELMKAVVSEVYDAIDRFMAERASTDPASRPLRQPDDRTPSAPTASPAAELRAYITGVVAFIDGHRTHMRALRSIFAALHDEEANSAAYDTDTERGVLGHIQDILLRGQANGDFREFDTLAMAATIQRSLDGLPLLLTAVPALDLPAHAAELVTLFDLATRATAQNSRSG